MQGEFDALWKVTYKNTLFNPHIPIQGMAFLIVFIFIFKQNAKMVMTSLSGHMMTLDFTASHQKW